MRNDGSQSRGSTSKEKFFDVTVVTTLTSTGAVSALTGNITSGAGVRQRTGDTVKALRMYVNYDLEAINADIFTVSRLIFFQWIPNTTISGAPAITSILQSANVNAMYNFQNANQYRILADNVHLQAGIAAAPTASGYQGYYGKIPIASAIKNLEFSEGVVTGSNQIFVALVSNSLIAPFPNLNLISRFIYTEDF